MQSPLDIILNTAKRIAGEGKKAVLNTNVGRGAQFVAKQTKDLVRGTGAFNEQTNLGIARNTITGLPKAAKDTFFPTRGYTEAELSQAKPTVKETALAIPKVFTEMGTSVSTLTDMIPGVKGLADRAIKSKAGDYLAQQGQKLQKFAQPETAGQAKAMRFADVASFLPVGSVKSLSSAARLIAKTQDAAQIAKELKAIGVADNVITGLSKELVDATDEVAISQRLTESLKPKVGSSLEQEAQALEKKAQSEFEQYWGKNPTQQMTSDNNSPSTFFFFQEQSRLQDLNSQIRRNADKARGINSQQDLKDIIATKRKLNQAGIEYPQNASKTELSDLLNGSTNPLIQEARKYKTAEEFIQAKNPIPDGGFIGRRQMEEWGAKTDELRKIFEGKPFYTPEQLKTGIEKLPKEINYNGEKYIKGSIGQVTDATGKIKRVSLELISPKLGVKDITLTGDELSDFYNKANLKIQKLRDEVSDLDGQIAELRYYDSPEDNALFDDLIVERDTLQSQLTDIWNKAQGQVEAPKTTIEDLSKEVEAQGYTLKVVDKKPKGYGGRHFSDSKTIEVYTKGRTPEQIRSTIDHEIGHIIDYKRRGIVADPMGDSVIGFDGKLRPAMDSDIYFRNNYLKKEAENIRKEFPVVHFAANTQKEIYADAYRIYRQNPVKLKEVAPTIYKQLDDFVKAESPKKTVTEAALDRDIAQARVETPRISEVDRLIAQGDIRIKQKDGMERYEYKSKDGTFKLAPTDEDAVTRVKQIQAQREAPKPQKKEFVVPDILANKMVDVQIKKDALANDPLNTLTKFVNKKTGELPEVTGTGKSTFARKGDNIVDEIYGGTKTSEDVRSEIPYFMERKRELKAQEKEITGEIAKLKKSEREKGTILRQLEKEADDVVRSRENAQKMPKQKDIQTLEEMAAQQSGTVVDNYLDKWASLPSSIKIKQTPVQKRIAFYDYIRTPIEVLKKIGLEKQGRLLIQKQDDYMQELPKNIEKITKWSKRAPSKEASERIFKYLDGKDIIIERDELKVANEIKVWLKEWADRLGLPADNRVADYITHLFDDQLIQKEFDEDLAKIIEDKIPGEVYNPFLEKRLGAKGYKQDVWAALDAYTKRATRKVHMDEALAELEQAAGTLEKSQWDYVKRFADNVNMRPSELEEVVDNAIKQFIGYKEGQRPTIKILGAARQMVARGAFSLNFGTALRNLSQGANTYAKLGEKYTALGYAKLFSKKNMQEVVDSGILEVGFIQDRVLSSRKQTLQKIDKVLFSFLDMAERVNRGAAYLGAKAKAIAMGKTEAEAIRYAKDLVAETQFRFGAVDTPVLLNGAILKTLTQFQSYTIKQIEFLANMLKNKEYAGLIRYAAAGLTFVYTIGKLFGMKPEELVPYFHFEAPPVFKGPWELGKAVLDTPDKYGQPRDFAQKTEDVMKPFALFIPASTQAQKTYKGINANIEGGSYTKDGKLQFESGKTKLQQVQNVLFGKYASPEAKAYFKRLEKNEETNAEIENVYNYIQELKAKGNEQEALQIFNDLSDEEKAIYKNVKSEKTKQENADGKRAVMPAFVEIRTLKDSGKAQEAIEAYNALSEEEKKYYQLLKKDHDALEKKLKAEEKVSAERNLVENIFAYAKALVVDPGQAWMALTTDEVLGDVRWTDVTLKRFMGKYFTEQGGSEEYVKKELEKMGIPYSDRSKYNLEHIIPVAAGGSNQPENLALIPRALHESYTEFDIALSKAVQSNKLSRKQAAQIAIKFKSGNMTKKDALQAIK